MTNVANSNSPNSAVTLRANAGSVLEDIVARKRVDVAERKRRVPSERLRRGLERSSRSLAAALRQPGARLICECKRASPSLGLLRENFDPAAIAAAYAPFAAALSIITDTPYFQGELAFIGQARHNFDGPILCKDFVIDPYQVIEARWHGADAILIMLSVLDDSQARACLAVAQRWGMDALVEVHDAQELQRALALDAAIIGINHRNLHTLEVTLEVSEQLAPLVPADRLVVAESGIHTRADLMRLGPLVDGFLVGSSLMRQTDLGAALRRLLFGRVKVCGLTRSADVIAAARSGAVWGGLIFAPASRRCVSLEQARVLRRSAPLKWAGVFVGEAVETVAKIAHQLALDAVQLHGEEGADERAALRNLLPPSCEIWQAVPVDVAADEERLAHTTAERATHAAMNSQRLLLDSRVGQNHGGTGQPFPYTALSRLSLDKHIIAGGLNPDNVADANRLNSWALDVNSGVESRPGQKSHGALAALFEALRPPCRKSGRPGTLHNRRQNDPKSSHRSKPS